MAATLTEALMGLGQLDVDLDYDAEVLAELVDGAVLVLSHGEDEVFSAQLLWDTPARAGIHIGGRGLDWRLGQDGDGPVILDREYLAGTNKLSNPSFEIEDLYWRRREGTLWEIRSLTGEPYAGSWAAAVIGDPNKDDALVTDEGGWEAREGIQFVATLRARRPSGAIGRLRLRIVFEGTFDPPQLLTNGGFVGSTDWTNTSAVTADAAIVGGHLRLGPTTSLQKIKNPSFESSLANWKQAHGAWSSTGAVTPVDGAYAATTAAGGPGQKTLEVDNDPGADQSIAVVAGERYRLDGWLRPAPGADGKAYIYTYIADVAYPGNPTWIYLDTIENQGGGATDWHYVLREFDIPEGKIALVPMCEVLGHTAGGGWYFDRVQLTRLKGNTASFRHAAFAVTPERTYHLLAPVTPDAGVIDGTVKVSVVLTGPGRAPVTIESSAISKGDGGRQLLSWDFTPPSGYDVATMSFIATDVVGGSFTVDDVSVTDSDRSTSVQDLVIGPAKVGWDPASTLTSAPAPAGTDRVRLEIVAEAGAGGWVVDNASLARVTASPATVEDVVRSVLVDPLDGTQLLEPGTIRGDDVLLYDLHVVRRAARDVLKHVCRSGVASPVREFRINPDGTVDVGTAEEVFTDRSDAIMIPGQLELLDEPTVERNWKDRVTDVLVIGAERTLANGRRVTIVGEAHDPPGGRRRTRVIEDSTVDHKAYADALAEWHLGQSKATDEVVQLRLADWRASFDFAVGDWIYPWLPEAGLEDLANEIAVDGLTAYPKRVRALARTFRLGSGPWRLELQRENGTRFDLSDFVRWEDATTADVTVGDVVPEFLVDPQGGAAGNQFLRFRASRPQ